MEQWSCAECDDNNADHSLTLTELREHIAIEHASPSFYCECDDVRYALQTGAHYHWTTRHNALPHLKYKVDHSVVDEIDEIVRRSTKRTFPVQLNGEKTTNGQSPSLSHGPLPTSASLKAFSVPMTLEKRSAEGHEKNLLKTPLQTVKTGSAAGKNADSISSVHRAAPIKMTTPRRKKTLTTTPTMQQPTITQWIQRQLPCTPDRPLSPSVASRMVLECKRDAMRVRLDQRRLPEPAPNVEWKRQLLWCQICLHLVQRCRIRSHVRRRHSDRSEDTHRPAKCPRPHVKAENGGDSDERQLLIACFGQQEVAVMARLNRPAEQVAVPRGHAVLTSAAIKTPKMERRKKAPIAKCSPIATSIPSADASFCAGKRRSADDCALCYERYSDRPWFDEVEGEELFMQPFVEHISKERHVWAMHMFPRLPFECSVCVAPGSCRMFDVFSIGYTHAVVAQHIVDCHSAASAAIVIDNTRDKRQHFIRQFQKCFPPLE